MYIDEGDELTHDERPAGLEYPFPLDVDGESFTVSTRAGDPNSHEYSWDNGPNVGYGFSSTTHAAYGSIQNRAGSPSGFEPLTVDDHRESIRDFLSGINPETGYLGD